MTSRSILHFYSTKHSIMADWDAIGDWLAAHHQDQEEEEEEYPYPRKRQRLDPEAETEEEDEIIHNNEGPSVFIDTDINDDDMTLDELYDFWNQFTQS